jgi:dynein regulatory complex protein 1
LYWERLTNVVSDENVKGVWEVCLVTCKYALLILSKPLERDLGKYNAMLNERTKLLEETDSIRQQNAELKGLLNQYLTSKINEDLLVPPVTIKS